MTTQTTLCPYCGYDVGDDEYCVACGTELEEIVVKPFSLRGEARGLCAWMQEKGFEGGEIVSRYKKPYRLHGTVFLD